MSITFKQFSQFVSLPQEEETEANLHDIFGEAFGVFGKGKEDPKAAAARAAKDALWKATKEKEDKKQQQQAAFKQDPLAKVSPGKATAGQARAIDRNPFGV